MELVPGHSGHGGNFMVQPYKLPVARCRFLASSRGFLPLKHCSLSSQLQVQDIHAMHRVAWAMGAVIFLRRLNTDPRSGRCAKLCSGRRAVEAHQIGARCSSGQAIASGQAPPQMAAWTRIEDLEQRQYPQRTVTVAQVQDPDFKGMNLEVMVEAGAWNVGDDAVILLPGARVTPELLESHPFRGAVASNGGQVPRMFYSKTSSYGILMRPPSTLERGEADIAQQLRVVCPDTVERRLLLELAFVGTHFNGSALCDNNSVCDNIREAIQKIGAVPLDRMKSFHRSQRWQTVSRTDKGVHARSFQLALPMLHLPHSAWVPGSNCAATAERLNAELPSAIRVFRALPLPHAADLHAVTAAREYRYFMPVATLTDSDNSDETNASTEMVRRLRSILQSCTGTRSFVNFTDIGNGSAFGKFCKRRQNWLFLQRLYSWRRQRKAGGYPRGSNVREPPLKPTKELTRLATRALLSVDVFPCEVTGMLCIKLVGEGFLYNMIRLLIGAACAVVRGDLSHDVFIRALGAEMVDLEMVDLSEFKAKAHGLVLYQQHLDENATSWIPRKGSASVDAADDFFTTDIVPALSAAWCQDRRLFDTLEPAEKYLVLTC